MPSKQPTNSRSKSLRNTGQLLKERTAIVDADRILDAAKPKTFKPLLLVPKPPAFDLSSKGKAKAKPKVETISLLDDDSNESQYGAESRTDDRLWVDVYEPQSEAELAVHKRKVEDVRRWFQEAFEGGPTGKLKKYRRILVLTGPAGTAKTSTIRVLSKELGFDILEWRNSLEESYYEGDYDRETLHQKFETFLSRASSCRALVNSGISQSTATPTSASSSSTCAFAQPQERRQIVLLEDLPNILHQPTQEMFHDALESFALSAQGIPLVIIISGASTRGEVRDEQLAQGGGGRWSLRDTIDVRTVLPPSLLNGPYVTQISFNPIAPTLMLRALQEMLARHYSAANATQIRRFSKEELNMIVETSNGDIRSAVMALQFACVLDPPKPRLTKGKKRSSRTLMESITRREQALVLFHLMGKILYNKRKGDPSNTTAPAKDRHREEALDARLKTPPPLPKWLAEHERRPSRVDVDHLYAESPIDTSLFLLYIHQNYPQFCDDIDQCSNLSDWLSCIDASGGEQWYQTNPHQFHLLTLGTLHSLPSPVSRRGQKMYKPEFFDVLKKTRDAEDAVLDVWSWLQDSSSARWSRDEIATEASAVLKTRTRGLAFGSSKDADVPLSHASFSTLVFTSLSTSKVSALDADGGDLVEDAGISVEDDVRHPEVKESAERDGEGWLSEDDIDEF